MVILAPAAAARGGIGGPAAERRPLHSRAMRVERPPDAAAFLRNATPFLVEREAQHCLMLGVAGNIARGALDMPPDGYYGVVRDEAGTVVAAALMTPPWHLVVSEVDAERIPAVTHALAADLATSPSNTVVRGVLGPIPVAEAFADAWCGPRHLERTVSMREHIYRLDRLIEPPPIEGAARRATVDDRDLLVDWVAAFHAEALGQQNREGAAVGVDRALKRGDRTYRLWEVDGVPVSTAASAGPTPNGIRIGPVYTPPEYRGRGFASAVTAAVTREELAVPGRRSVFLFTDVHNPTSNKIYQSIGYQRVGDMEQLVFESR